MSMEREQGAWSGSGEQGIITFSAEWLGNLLSFLKEIPMTVDIGTFSHFVIFRVYL
jgi:hypothetical protein